MHGTPPPTNTGRSRIPWRPRWRWTRRRPAGKCWGRLDRRTDRSTDRRASMLHTLGWPPHPPNTHTHTARARRPRRRARAPRCSRARTRTSCRGRPGWRSSGRRASRTWWRTKRSSPSVRAVLVLCVSCSLIGSVEGRAHAHAYTHIHTRLPNSQPAHRHEPAAAPPLLRPPRHGQDLHHPGLRQVRGELSPLAGRSTQRIHPAIPRSRPPAPPHPNPPRRTAGRCTGPSTRP